MEKKNPAEVPDLSPRRDRPGLFFSAGARWLNIGARTLHLAAVSVFFGGVLLAVPFARLESWRAPTIASGLALLALEWLHDTRWWRRGKGLLVLFHLALFLLISILPAYALPLMWLVLISGCVGSHMPRRFRHWSILDGWEKQGRGES